MSGTNAELIKEARAAANMGREYAENYSGANPPDSIPWENADLIDKLADALEAAAERAAVIAETAFLLHEIGTPGEGPFTNGQRYADEARAQIAAQIRAAK